MYELQFHYDRLKDRQTIIVDAPSDKALMQAPALKFLAVGGPSSALGSPRRMAYWDWSSLDPDSKHVVVCVHGLSRQGRDFDNLAKALVPTSRVIAVDVAGRGHSDWLADPMQYQVPTYVADLAVLLQALRTETPDITVDWVGTSMGGLIGMAIAAQPVFGLRRLVLNDVGPVIQWVALQRIGTYLGQDPVFPSQVHAFDYLASISPGFGVHTPEEWRSLNEPMLIEREGAIHLHYDPAIALPLRALLSQADVALAQQSVRDSEALLWQLYDAISCDTLLLRGADSDLLAAATVQDMSRRGPKARCVTFEGVGHAPTLMSVDQVRAVEQFLVASVPQKSQ
jgi:pimeloyl-ACP methyl ester carboxylesterase